MPPASKNPGGRRGNHIDVNDATRESYFDAESARRGNHIDVNDATRKSYFDAESARCGNQIDVNDATRESQCDAECTDHEPVPAQAKAYQPGVETPGMNAFFCLSPFCCAAGGGATKGGKEGRAITKTQS